jgi:hypothetical protein
MIRDDFDKPLVVPRPPVEENDVGQPFDWRVYALAAVCIFLLLVALYFMIGADRNDSFDIQSKTTCNCNFEHRELIGRSPYIQAAHAIFNRKIVNDPESCGFDDAGYLFGSSMQPTYWEGNTALEINYTKNYVLRPGMIIRYNTASTEDCPLKTPPVAGQYIIHRIEAIYDDTIITAGDNNPFNEEIKSCQVTHVVVGILFT